MITKKHFNKFAEIISELRKDCKEKISADILISKLATFFREENSNFDTSRFVEACEPKYTPRELLEKIRVKQHIIFNEVSK